MNWRRGAIITLGVVPAALLFWIIAPAGAAAADSVAPKTPIRHFIVLMQENHSFDNYFGTYPGADGIPPGTCVPVDPSKGPEPCVKPFHIGGRPIQDLDHNDSTGILSLNGGRMDGFVKAQNIRGWSGELAMGYYDDRDLPFHWNVADRYVLFDRMFTSAQGGSFLNHVYWVAAGPGDSTGSVPPEGLRVTTIFDRLQEAGVSWKFYVENYDPAINYRTMGALENPNRASQAVWVPLLTIPRFIDDPELSSHIVDSTQYFIDLSEGTLPEVAYIVPSGRSEHPPGSLVAGQRFIRGLVNALMASSYWDSSAFMYTYDDWGGWYDHVRPPRRDAYGNGFRVPALLVSAYARPHFIDHTTLDFTSIVKFIYENWGLRPMGRLDATATPDPVTGGDVTLRIWRDGNANGIPEAGLGELLAEGTSVGGAPVQIDPAAHQVDRHVRPTVRDRISLALDLDSFGCR